MGEVRLTGVVRGDKAVLKRLHTSAATSAVEDKLI